MAEPAPEANAAEPAVEVKAPVIEAKAMVEPAPAPKAAEPAIEVKASGSAVVALLHRRPPERGPPSGQEAGRSAGDRAAEGRPGDTTPIGTAPPVATPGEDVSGQGRS